MPCSSKFVNCLWSSLINKIWRYFPSNWHLTLINERERYNFEGDENDHWACQDENSPIIWSLGRCHVRVIAMSVLIVKKDRKNEIMRVAHDPTSKSLSINCPDHGSTVESNCASLPFGNIVVSKMPMVIVSNVEFINAVISNNRRRWKRTWWDAIRALM